MSVPKTPLTILSDFHVSDLSLHFSGADTNNGANTMPLGNIHRSARLGDIDALRMAIAEGADINERDKFGATALQCAIAEKQISAADELLSLGADVTAQDSSGLTALHYAIEHKLPQVLETLLKKAPEAISICDKHGNQPLWTAAFNARGEYEMVSMLLNFGADPEHRNNVNLTPLDIPKRKSEPALLQLLESRRVKKG
jgi:uncharacterized protein